MARSVPEIRQMSFWGVTRYNPRGFIFERAFLFLEGIKGVLIFFAPKGGYKMEVRNY